MAGIISERRSYVAGKWVEGDEALRVENPADESTVTEISATPLSEIERAVAEARHSFDSGVWADAAPSERARVLHAFLDRFEASRAALVATMVAEAGQPTAFAEHAQFQGGLAVARGTIDLYLSMAHEEANPVPADELVRGRVALSLRRHEPVGVVSAITPYNGAIVMALQKIVPALLAGNSVILRPSPLTPISSLVFGAAADAAGLPPGVLSVVVENGAAGAELLTTHPAVDMVSFTGSTVAGILVAKAAADTVKRVHQELGGKSANILLDDVDLKKAVKLGVESVMRNSGQSCNAPTRMFVPAQLHEDALAIARETAEPLKVGAPQAESVFLGPVVSEIQYDKIQRLIESGIKEGATLVTGGPGRPEELNRGYYVRPTVFGGVTDEMTIAREEIFGPVLSILPYESEAEVIARANDTPYGLASYIQSGSLERARKVAAQMRSGNVYINYPAWDAGAPFGGYKQSGNGREYADFGLEEFLEIKGTVGYAAA